MVGLEIAKFAREVRMGREWIPLGATALGSVIFNMAAGFAIGLCVYYITGLFTGKEYAK